MKKILGLIIIILLCSFTNVYAESILELSNPIIEFNNIDNYNLQGFTVTDKYLFMVLVGYDDTRSIIQVYDLDTYTLISSVNYGSLGHANDVAYNESNDMIYVLDSGGSNIVHSFKNKSFEYVDSFKIDLPGRSIAYVNEKDCYIVRTVATGFILNNEFELKQKMPFITGMNFRNDIGRQGWDYYNGYIYYSNWSWIRLGGDGSNIIYVYDLDGKKRDILYTDNNIGEIEGVSFYKDKMVLGFNGYDERIKFYMIDVPEVAEISTNESEADDEVEVDTNNVNNKYYYYIIGIVACLIVFLGIRKKIK